jgi:hypothetical protein
MRSKGARPSAGLPSSLAKLGRAVDTLTNEAQGLRKAAVTLEDETARHPMPTLRPAVAASHSRARRGEVRLVTGTRPAALRLSARGRTKSQTRITTPGTPSSHASM